MSKPIVAVTGATGQQGGSVVEFLLRDGTYDVRAVTRNIDSPKAKGAIIHTSLICSMFCSNSCCVEMSGKGVQVVSADFNDVESLKKAFEGVYGVFGMTNGTSSNFTQNFVI